MLAIRKIRQNPQEVRDALKLRNQTVSIDPFLMQDEQRRALLLQSEEKKTLRNQHSKQMGMARKKGASEVEMAAMTEAMRKVNEEIAALDTQIAQLDQEMENFLLSLPNLPHASVPVGEDADSNVEVRKSGTPRIFEWEPKSSEEIRNDLGLVSACSASVLRGLGAKLELSLARFLLDVFSDNGYEELLFSAQNACIAELFRDAILTHLPVSVCAYAPASSQIVLNQIIQPEEECSALERMTEWAEKAIAQLGLCCRVVEQCTGCLAFSAAKTYALEVWMPSRQSYVCAASCSDCSDFTARRMSIRYRLDEKAKPQAAHTISGSLNLSCIMDAVLENFQNGDGTVNVPECLKETMKTALICK